jgi:hypothetical protein
VNYETAKKIASTMAADRKKHSLASVKEDTELLLVTGAKLVFNWKGEWQVSGYADDGKDVQNILAKL